MRISVLKHNYVLNQLCPLNERCEKLYDLNFNHPNSKSYETHPPCTALPIHTLRQSFSQILTFSLAFSSFSLFSQFLPINSEKFFFSPYLLFARHKIQIMWTHVIITVSKVCFLVQLHITIYQCLYLLNSWEVQESQNLHERFHLLSLVTWIKHISLNHQPSWLKKVNCFLKFKFRILLYFTARVLKLLSFPSFLEINVMLHKYSSA